MSDTPRMTYQQGVEIAAAKVAAGEPPDVIVEYDADRTGEHVVLTYMHDPDTRFKIPLAQAADIADGIAGLLQSLEDGT